MTTQQQQQQPPHQHGVKGVYYGGTWLDLEDCAGTFTNVEDRCSGCPNHNHHNHNSNGSSTTPPGTTVCPRSQSANAAAQESSSSDSDSTTIPVYDVVIIGAGCIGAAIAREMAKYEWSHNKVLWLEAADDVSQGATKGNSGIVHAGYDDTPGTNRAKYCWKGNQQFPQLDRELRFGYQLNGSLVLAKNTPQDRKELEELLERGRINGVQRLRIVEREELLQMEPHISNDIVAALYSPDAGNVIPYVRRTKKSSRQFLSTCRRTKNVPHFLPFFPSSGVYHCLGRKCRR
jgi:glycerol-3-phosphate dehydrogenase